MLPSGALHKLLLASYNRTTFDGIVVGKKCLKMFFDCMVVILFYKLYLITLFCTGKIKRSMGHSFEVLTRHSYLGLAWVALEERS